MDSDDAERAPARPDEGEARFEARMRRISLLWWGAVCVFSCLLDVATDAPREWLGDIANYAVGSGVAATWSLLATEWLGRRRRSRRKVVRAGLGFAALGGLVSGAAAAIAGVLAILVLKVQQIIIYCVGFDLEHYTALFLGWGFIYLMVFSLEQTARIEERVVRLRVLMLKAEDAALRERVRPEWLNAALSKMRTALALRRRKEAESIVMALAESLRASLSSETWQAPQGELGPGEADHLSVAKAVYGRVGFGVSFAERYKLTDCAFWGCAFLIIVAFLSPTYLYSAFRNKLFFVVDWMIVCIVGFLCSVLLRFVWRILTRISGVVERCVAAVMVGIVAALVSAWTSAEVWALVKGASGLNWRIIFVTAEYYVPLYIAWHCVYFSSEAFRREIAQRALLARTTEAAATARNSMLRYQVRPHFLFNALNALYALIADGRWVRAGAMTEALSAYIERSFAEDERELVPIGEQAKALQTYLSIERVRFGDRLRIRVDIPERLGHACAPSLILHPLVENAMKYAVASTADPVEVEIAADHVDDMLLLSVRDSGGDPEAPAAPGLGIGLRNVAARLTGHYGERGRLECKRLTPKGFVAEIRLPLEFACTTFAA